MLLKDSKGTNLRRSRMTLAAGCGFGDSRASYSFSNILFQPFSISLQEQAKRIPSSFERECLRRNSQQEPHACSSTIAFTLAIWQEQTYQQSAINLQCPSIMIQQLVSSSSAHHRSPVHRNDFSIRKTRSSLPAFSCRIDARYKCRKQPRVAALMYRRSCSSNLVVFRKSLRNHDSAAKIA